MEKLLFGVTESCSFSSVKQYSNITLGCKLTKNFTSRGDKSSPGLDLYADLEPGDVDLLEEGTSVENQDPAFR